MAKTPPTKAAGQHADHRLDRCQPTLEMFLLTLTRKWDPAPRPVLFDLDRGCEIAIRALGWALLYPRSQQNHRLQPAAARADTGASSSGSS